MMRPSTKHMAVFALALCMGGFLMLILTNKHNEPTPIVAPVGIQLRDQEKYMKLAAQFVPSGFDESKAANVAIENSERWSRARAESNDAHDTLCTTFIKLPQPADNIYLENMKNEGTKACTWVFIVYKYDESNKEQLLRDFKEQIANAFSSKAILDQPNFDVLFAPPRQDIISSIHNICKSMQDTDRFAEFHMSESCKELEASVITMDTAAGISQAGNFNALVFPKVLLFMQLLPYLDKFRFVWILDGDISLQGFNLSRFLTLMHCTLPTTPLIAQPVVHENTQTYKYLNKKSWSKSRVLAAQTGFIEVQVPLVESALFRYYLLSFVLPVVIPAHILGADWGFDELFCSVAKLYDAVTSPQFAHLLKSDLPEHTLLLGSANTLRTQRSFNGAPVGSQAQALRDLLTNRAMFKETIETEKSIVAVHGEKLAAERSATQRYIRSQLLTSVLDSTGSVCAVIVGSAVHHRNSKETNNLVGYDAKRTLNTRMMSIVEATYPGFHKRGKGATADPLHVDSRLVKADTVRNNCAFRA